jgi:hypothetical protein
MHVLEQAHDYANTLTSIDLLSKTTGGRSPLSVGHLRQTSLLSSWASSWASLPLSPSSICVLPAPANAVSSVLCCKYHANRRRLAGRTSYHDRGKSATSGKSSRKTRLTRLGQCCIIACGLGEGHFKKPYYSAQRPEKCRASPSFARRRSSVAEQLFCKQLVVSSNLTVGSMGSCRSGQSELAVNQSGFALRRFESFTAHRTPGAWSAWRYVQSLIAINAPT